MCPLVHPGIREARQLLQTTLKWSGALWTSSLLRVLEKAVLWTESCAHNRHWHVSVRPLPSPTSFFVPSMVQGLRQWDARPGEASVLRARPLLSGSWQLCAAHHGHILLKHRVRRQHYLSQWLHLKGFAPVCFL